jgi:hypothetical protein
MQIDNVTARVGQYITPRQLRDFINLLPEDGLDEPILLHVDGGCAESDDADFRNGVLNLY